MIKLIIIDIYTCLQQYAIHALLTGSVVLVVSCLLVRLLSKKERSDIFLSYRRLIVLCYIFYCYCFIVIGTTLMSREPGSRDRIDLVPLSTFSPNLWNNRYPIENIILFLPFGFMLPLMCKQFRSLKFNIAAGFTLSLGIEIIQYITKRGFFQTDDIITNVIGTIIGYITAYLVQILKGKHALRRSSKSTKYL